MFNFSKPLFFCIVILCVAFVCTLSASLSVPLPIGSDTMWHLNIANIIFRDGFVAGWDYTLGQNLFPYGLLLFQCCESVFYFVGEPVLFVKVLQVLFLPFTLGLTMLVVYRYASGKAAVYCGMFLFGSWAFMDGALQVRPESLDLLFYPLLLGAVLVGARWRFVGLAVVAVFSHGVAALSMFVGWVVVKFRVKCWRWPLIVGVLLVLPVLVMSVFYVGGAFVKWGGAPVNENPQEVLFWSDPSFVPYYMGAGLLAVPFLFRKNKSLLEWLAVYGLVGNLVMLPLWADRWLHYVSLPLAIVGGVGLAELPQEITVFGRCFSKLWIVFILLDIYVVYSLSFFGFSFGWLGHWAQLGD